jgi:hypothetical protein
MSVVIYQRSSCLPAALTFCFLAAGSTLSAGPPTFPIASEAAQPSQDSVNQQAAQAATRRQVGTIKAIERNNIVLATDTGDVTVVVQDGAQIVRVEPGQKDLTGATTLELRDLEVGDRILVRGRASADGKSLAATAIIAMKHADLEVKQQHEREEWQHGTGGLVNGVDRSAGIITIRRGSLDTIPNIAVHVTKDTVIRRYAPDSVKFDDAKPSSLEAIKPGDQLRARGIPSANGGEFDAEEIVSGSFQNIAGPISSIDTNTSTVFVKDAITKRSIAVKITDQSQVRKFPTEMAQRIAARLKATANRADALTTTGPGSQIPAHGPSEGRAPDLQQLLSRVPTAKLADLQSGDEVMIVSTEPNASGQVTAITLLAGVEPILTASPQAAQAMMLSPWSLGGGDTGADETNP